MVLRGLHGVGFAVACLVTAAPAQTPTTVKIPVAHIERQKGAQWCWAASIQSILATYGVHVEQETVVKATWGSIVDLPVFDPSQAVTNLLKANAKVAPEGRVVHPFYSVGVPIPAFVVHELSVEKAPFMIFYRQMQGGHVVVCNGVEYQGSAENPIITKIFVQDPWTGQEQTWGGADLANRWAATIFCRVAPLPRMSWIHNGKRYSLSPTFDVLNSQGFPVGRVWYHRKEKEWRVHAGGVDRGPIPQES